MALKPTPQLKLLLNNLDVPNQVIRANEQVRILAVTDPPIDPASNYRLAPLDLPDAFVRAGGRGKDIYTVPDAQPEPLEIVAELYLGDKVQSTVTKQIYVLKVVEPKMTSGGDAIPSNVRQGQPLHAELSEVDLLLFSEESSSLIEVKWRSEGVATVTPNHNNPRYATIGTDRVGLAKIYAELWNENEPLYRKDEQVRAVADFEVEPADGGTGVVSVSLQRSAALPTADQALWSLIRHRTGEISSTNYIAFVDQILCGGNLGGLPGERQRELKDAIGGLSGYGTSSYEVLKYVTELFLLTRCGTYDSFDPDSKALAEESARLGETVGLTELRTRIQTYLGNSLPYLDRVILAAFPGLETTDSYLCEGLIRSRVESPCLLELIWSYWHEEGMLVQGTNAVSRRFQNVRGPGPRDPLAHFELDPLRPLNNILWGYVQDERKRLSVNRRAYEYNHHYGLALYGNAVPPMRPADSRSKFLEAFHSLLSLAFGFYKEDSDTTVIADGYPLLNALKEVHMILAQGAHNQFGDLPWTARVEMLIQQWMFARPEMRDFLQSRPMVPYKEPWMPAVDTLKTLQGWSDVSVTHFSDLGTYGEQILLSIRYGDWIGINDENSAKNWARYWRPEVQGYIHAYRAVTGVDLTYPERVDAILPAIHLQKRLALQHARGGPAMLSARPGRARQFLPRL